VRASEIYFTATWQHRFRHYSAVMRLFGSIRFTTRLVRRRFVAVFAELVSPDIDLFRPD